MPNLLSKPCNIIGYLYVFKDLYVKRLLCVWESNVQWFAANRLFMQYMGYLSAPVYWSKYFTDWKDSVFAFTAWHRAQSNIDDPYQSITIVLSSAAEYHRRIISYSFSESTFVLQKIIWM